MMITGQRLLALVVQHFRRQIAVSLFLTSTVASSNSYEEEGFVEEDT